jgi:SAM-dependent methyltransferase
MHDPDRGVAGQAGARSVRPVEFETIPCVLCGGSESRPIFRSRDLRYETTPRDEFVLVECSDCGLRYLNPRPTEAALAAFYPEDYYSYRPNEHEPGAGLLRRLYPTRRERLLREKVGRATGLMPAGGRFIEYGPSAGQFLSALTRKGFTGVGIERSESMVRHVRENLGLECHQPAEFARSAHEPVHLVALWNVLEHLPDPIGFLRWTKGVLTPEGRLLFSVPNARAIERRIFFREDPCEDIPRHLYSYTPDTIRRILEQEGFTDIRVDHVSRVAMSELQERTERAIQRRPGGRRLKKILYTGSVLPFFWAWDRIAALFGRSHTMVVTARLPKGPTTRRRD